MTSSATPTKTHPYHHGDLPHALIEAAVELAREGGPGAIVLREAARRVGVSPNAAYRHFDSLPDLVVQVALVALHRMALTMQAELERCVSTDDPGLDAQVRMEAVGRGYVRFALEEPGLFATAFTSPEKTGMHERANADNLLTPETLLTDRLDELVATGVLNPDEYDAAAKTGWGIAHGLSMLLLGPLSGVPLDERQALIDACLHIVTRGIRSS
ncbi:MAG TPA: TetR/AcrR family transcriptional regulator [Acidothermaceae bacterium]